MDLSHLYPALLKEKNVILQVNEHFSFTFCHIQCFSLPYMLDRIAWTTKLHWINAGWCNWNLLLDKKWFLQCCFSSQPRPFSACARLLLEKELVVVSPPAGNLSHKKSSSHGCCDLWHSGQPSSDPFFSSFFGIKSKGRSFGVRGSYCCSEEGQHGVGGEKGGKVPALL